MLAEVVAGAIVIACIAIVIFLLTRPNEPVTITKNIEGGQELIRIRANKDVASVSVIDTVQGGLSLKRTGLKRGGAVEFHVPISQNPVRVQVEDEKETKVYDI